MRAVFWYSAVPELQARFRDRSLQEGVDLFIRVIAVLALMFGLSVQMPSVQAAELVYFGSSACSVCEMWDEEVGRIYPKTAESKIIPLRYHDVHDERPDDLSFIRGVIYTPTFVAVEDGREVGRIVGYMGDFFFWEQLDGLIKKLPEQSQQISGCPQNASGKSKNC